MAGVPQHHGDPMHRCGSVFCIPLWPWGDGNLSEQREKLMDSSGQGSLLVPTSPIQPQGSIHLYPQLWNEGSEVICHGEMVSTGVL